MENWTTAIGVIAATTTVAGSIYALVRWVVKTLGRVDKRLTDLEEAMRIHRRVRIRKTQLVTCHGMRGAVLSVQEGATGSLLEVENGTASVRLDGGTTVVEIQLGELEDIEGRHEETAEPKR